MGTVNFPRKSYTSLDNNIVVLVNNNNNNNNMMMMMPWGGFAETDASHPNLRFSGVRFQEPFEPPLPRGKRKTKLMHPGLGRQTGTEIDRQRG